MATAAPTTAAISPVAGLVFGVVRTEMDSRHCEFQRTWIGFHSDQGQLPFGIPW